MDGAVSAGAATSVAAGAEGSVTTEADSDCVAGVEGVVVEAASSPAQELATSVATMVSIVRRRMS